jgi:hypothetical protein
MIECPTNEEGGMSTTAGTWSGPQAVVGASQAPGAQRASSHHETQAASDRAREIVHNASGGDAITHASDTVTLGTTPFRRATPSKPPNLQGVVK